MGLRERLVGRPRLASVCRLKVDDTDAAERAVDVALEQHRLAQMLVADGKSADVAGTKRKLDKAQAALDACFEPVTIRAMAPPDYEALLAEHPAPKDSDNAFAETLPRALFLACVEGDMGQAEWEAFLDESASQGEREALYLTALQVNTRPPDESIPKG